MRKKPAAEIYLSVLAGDRRLPLRAIVRNALTLIRMRLRAPTEVEKLLGSALRNTFFSPTGVFRARIELGLGRMYRMRRRPALAREHLEQARLAACKQNAVSLLARVEANLADLAKSPSE